MKEEEIYKNWFKNILSSIDGLNNDLDLFEEISKGITILKIIDYLCPDSVDFKLAETVTNNRFKRINNCNLIIDSMNNINLKIESISSIDLVDKKKERCFGILWQLMRYHYLKIHGFINNVDEDKEIKDWVIQMENNEEIENLNLDDGDEILPLEDRHQFFEECLSDFKNYWNPSIYYIEEDEILEFVNFPKNIKNKKKDLKFNFKKNNKIKILDSRIYPKESIFKEKLNKNQKIININNLIVNNVLDDKNLLIKYKFDELKNKKKNNFNHKLNPSKIDNIKKIKIINFKINILKELDNDKKITLSEDFNSKKKIYKNLKLINKNLMKTSEFSNIEANNYFCEDFEIDICDDNNFCKNIIFRINKIDFIKIDDKINIDKNNFLRSKNNNYLKIKKDKQNIKFYKVKNNKILVKNNNKYENSKDSNYKNRYLNKNFNTQDFNFSSSKKDKYENFKDVNYSNRYLNKNLDINDYRNSKNKNNFDEYDYENNLDISDINFSNPKNKNKYKNSFKEYEYEENNFNTNDFNSSNSNNKYNFDKNDSYNKLKKNDINSNKKSKKDKNDYKNNFDINDINYNKYKIKNNEEIKLSKEERLKLLLKLKNSKKLNCKLYVKRLIKIKNSNDNKIIHNFDDFEEEKSEQISIIKEDNVKAIKPLIKEIFIRNLNISQYKNKQTVRKISNDFLNQKKIFKVKEFFLNNY